VFAGPRTVENIHRSCTIAGGVDAGIAASRPMNASALSRGAAQEGERARLRCIERGWSRMAPP
jgi:hypothetical protein